MSRIVIALGGNALGTRAGAARSIDAATPSLVGLIADEHRSSSPTATALRSGDQPRLRDRVAPHRPGGPMDLPECTAMSQGYIGYHLQQGIAKELRRSACPGTSLRRDAGGVAADDPAFAHPTKPSALLRRGHSA